MRSLRILTAVFAVLLAIPALYAQDKSSQEPQFSPIPLKIQVLLTEYAGTQKVSSLPYTIYTLAYPPLSVHWIGDRRATHLRFGVKVPLTTGPDGQFTYEDVGTNIDCDALQADGGKVGLDFTVERSSVSVPGASGEESEWKPGDQAPSPHPMIRNFRDSFFLVMRDGATMEGTSAVDPVTGHVLKIEVTLNELK